MSPARSSGCAATVMSRPHLREGHRLNRRGNRDTHHEIHGKAKPSAILCCRRDVLAVGLQAVR